MAAHRENRSRPSKPQYNHGPQPKKILFLGDEGVGKTTFIKTFLDHHHDTYDMEVFEGNFLVFKQFLFYRQEDDGDSIPIQLLDLPAGTTPHTRTDQYPTTVNSIVLCFAVNDPDSFMHIQQFWLPEIRRYYSAEIHFFLLGLKTDMRDDEQPERPSTSYREPVTTDRGRQIHTEYDFFGQYMECSATENPALSIILMDRLICDIFDDDDEELF